MTAPQAAQKTKLNLTAVTPQPPPPENVPIDTKTPVDATVIPFTQLDTPKWGPWMMARLAFLWPHVNSMNYMSILMQIMGDKGSILIRSRRAIVLAVMTRESMEPRPVVDIIFCFKHDPNSQEQDKDVSLLFRRVEDWARGMGARGVRIMNPDNCDSARAKTRDILGAEDTRHMFKAITK